MKGKSLHDLAQTHVYGCPTAKKRKKRDQRLESEVAFILHISCSPISSPCGGL